MVSIRAGTKVIAFELGLPLMPSTKVSLMLKFARLAAGNPMLFSNANGVRQIDTQYR